MKNKNNKKNIVKNICYLIMLAMFLAGGFISLANCVDNNPAQQAEAPQSGDTTEEQASSGESEAPGEIPEPEPEPEPPQGDILPYDKLKIDSNSLVGIARSDKAHATDLTFDDIKALIREAVELAGGLGDIIKDGDTVVLKPNLVNHTDYTLPGWRGRRLATEANGNCTDWRVTKAAAQLVRELNPSGKIYIMEGPAIDSFEVFEALNYTKANFPEVDEIIAIDLDSGEWGDKNSPGLVKVVYNNALLNKEYYLNRRFYEADVIINLPTLKNHWSAVTTGSVKNIAIGATPASIYGQGRGDNLRMGIEHDTDAYHRFMADFYFCRPADFTITEALQGIENGPTPGYDQGGVAKIEDAQKNLRAMLASKDGLAIDIVHTNIMNWDIETVSYLQYLASKNTAGNGETKNITVRGVKVDDIRTDFAGTIPPAGGKKLTQTQKSPPSLEINYAAFDGQNLKLGLNLSDNAEKIDIYIDGEYAGSANNNLNQIITLNAMRFGAGARDIKIYAYTKYMAHAEANITAEKSDGEIILGQYDYAAPFAGTAPVIDGKGGDPAWARAEWRPIDQAWLGGIPDPSVFSGRYKIVWTEDRLYYLVEITDNYISATRADRPLFEVWNDDCLELFINEDGLGGNHERSHNAFAYHLSFGGENVVDLNTKGEPFLVNDHINYKIHRTPGTDIYTWEAEMKIYDKTYDEDNHGANVPVKLHDGKIMGFAVAYCDADETNSRERFIGSVYIPGENKNIAWQNADVFAGLYLIN